MIALIAGASGLVGKVLLAQLLEDNTYTEVRILVRRQIDLVHPKLRQVIADFDNLAKGELAFHGVHKAFCTLGTTMAKAGSKEAFYKVDYTYILSFAEMAKKHGASHFILVSSMGADANSRIYYSKVKGEVENAVKALNFTALHILQPSILLGNRQESRLGERIGIGVAKLFAMLIPSNYKGIEAAQVALAMRVLAADGRTGTYITQSGALQKLKFK